MRIERGALAALVRTLTAALVVTACLVGGLSMGAMAAPGDPSPSSASAPVPLPGIQSPAPGTAQTAPAAPAAPGEPFPWAFVVFGVLGVALLIAWAVLARRDSRD